MLFLQAAFIGFSIAVPLGPIGLLCINQALRRGVWGGLAVGGGAAMADGLYAMLGAAGWASSTAWPPPLVASLRASGGALLLYLALKTYRAVPKEDVGDGKDGVLKVVVTTFFLTLSNPLTIVSFAALFAALPVTGLPVTGLPVMGLGLGSPAFGLAVALGSLFWWVILSSLAALCKRGLPPAMQRWTRIGSASVLAWFGLCAMRAVISQLL